MIFLGRKAFDDMVESYKERVTFLEAELAKAQAENHQLVNALTAANRSVAPYPQEKKQQLKPLIKRVSPFHKAKQLERLTQAPEMPGRPLWSYPNSDNK
jgi:hypothetical protein